MEFNDRIGLFYRKFSEIFGAIHIFIPIVTETASNCKFLFYSSKTVVIPSTFRNNEYHNTQNNLTCLAKV